MFNGGFFPCRRRIFVRQNYCYSQGCYQQQPQYRCQQQSVNSCNCNVFNSTQSQSKAQSKINNLATTGSNSQAILQSENNVGLNPNVLILGLEDGNDNENEKSDGSKNLSNNSDEPLQDLKDVNVDEDGTYYLDDQVDEIGNSNLIKKDEQ